MNSFVRIFVLTGLGGILLFLSCQKELSCEDCIGDNKPPVADAGHDLIIVLPKDTVELNGSNSKDPDGTITRYSWKKISGPSTPSFGSASSVKTMVRNLVLGSYQFELEVTDTKGLTGLDTVIVSVEKTPVNHPPVADVGPDILITLPRNSVNLDGSRSWDPDNNITGYAWIKIAGPSIVSLGDPLAKKTTADNLMLGSYKFELTVTDAGGLFSRDTLTVKVDPSPDAYPVADAGDDIVVTYNMQTCSIDPSLVTLDGSRSFDTDGTIILYSWSLLSGPNQGVIISNPNAMRTTITNLVPGDYSFRLEVTDNAGGTDEDTVWLFANIIGRPEVNIQLIPVGTLSVTRKVAAVTTAGGKLFFAGGNTPPTSPGPHPSSRVDIYDITTNSWSTAELSKARWGLTAIASGNKVMFAGGTGIGNTNGVSFLSTMDIYDLVSGLWTAVEMPRPGWYSSITHGNKVFFAGGSAIDIYNVSTGLWSGKPLSQPRYQITPSNILGKLYFSGGSSNTSGGSAYSRIDIHDPVGDSWSSSELSSPKYGMAAIGMRTQSLWAGGKTNSGNTNEVELHDIMTGSVSFSCLFQANSFSQYSLGKSGNRVIFFVWDGANKSRFDILDVITNTWSIGVLSQAIAPSLVLSVDGDIYVVGTTNSNGFHDTVWKLQF